MKIRKHNPRPLLSVTAFVLIAGLLIASAQDSVPPPELPDSPGTVATEQKAAATGSSSSQGQAAPATQSSAPQSGASTIQKPVGTAAAEKPGTTGVAASDAAGAAIAPAKQKHTHALLIKVGAIVGAGVALGTVAAFSSASPSRPPGSH